MTHSQFHASLVFGAIVVLAGVGGTSGGPAIGLAKSILNFSALKGGTPATEFASVTAFKGLPYAAPPVGPLRWHEPEMPVRWSAVRKW